MTVSNPVAPLPVDPEFVKVVEKYAQKLGGYIEHTVQEAAEFVRMKIGDTDAVDRAQHAWGVDAAGALATANEDIQVAVRDQSAYWEGPGERAFADYASHLTAQADRVKAALLKVRQALSDAMQEITNVYNQVIGLIGTCAQVLLTFDGGGLKGLSEDVLETAGKIAGAIVDALKIFVSDFTNAIKAAKRTIAKYHAIADAEVSAIAALGDHPIPSIPIAARDAGEYQVVHRPSV